MSFIRTRTIKGRPYLYEETRYRVGGKVKSKSRYIGPGHLFTPSNILANLRRDPDDFNVRNPGPSRAEFEEKATKESAPAPKGEDTKAEAATPSSSETGQPSDSGDATSSEGDTQ